MHMELDWYGCGAQPLTCVERVNDGETHLFTSLVTNWV